MMNLFLASFALLAAFAAAKTLVVSPEDRQNYIRNASVFLQQQDNVPSLDFFNGPPNPYGLKTWQQIECDFVQPDVNDILGGTTPKFHCDYLLADGSTQRLKIKYDQQYNTAYQGSRSPANHEVYSSVVSQRVMWAMGLGSDHSVPVTVRCRNCPIEPWTYIQAVQGYDTEDELSGWLDLELLKSGLWNTTLPYVDFTSAIVYIKLDKYFDGDSIEWIDESGVQQSGFDWKEMYDFPSSDTKNNEARDALSVIAAFLSHCDNFNGNQGFICLDNSSKKTCKGRPLLYIHDIGGSLGYGWSIKHVDLWPNYVDLKQWLEAEMWGNLKLCQVSVNGIPGSSWHGNLKVSESGRALASQLVAKISNQQLQDVFTSARINLMRNDSVQDWITGFEKKMNDSLFNSHCFAK